MLAGGFGKFMCNRSILSCSCIRRSFSQGALTTQNKDIVVARRDKEIEPTKPTPDAVPFDLPDSIDVSHISGIPEEHIVGRRARIFMPARVATQAGNQNTKLWKIELDNRERWEGTLVGWCASGDPLSNISMTLNYANKEDAIRFCERQGWEYEVEEPQVQKIKPKAYGTNFSWNKKIRISTK